MSHYFLSWLLQIKKFIEQIKKRKFKHWNKRENAHNEHFLVLSQYFLKSSAAAVSNANSYGKWLEKHRLLSNYSLVPVNHNHSADDFPNIKQQDVGLGRHKSGADL